jgi:hypothetical protein
MKKYIFTESQIKKIVDNEINEQMMGSAVQKGNLSTMEYNMVNNKNPKFVDQIKKQGKLKVIDFEESGKGIFLKGGKGVVKISKGQIITPQTEITLPMSSRILISGMGISQGQITYGQNSLEFTDYVA